MARRSTMPAAICTTPAMIAQIAMITSSTTAVSPGSMMATRPARMPTTPISTLDQRCPRTARPSAIELMPSTSA